MKKTLRVLSLFSGIGAFEKALKNRDIPYELINYCEINEHASKAYSLIHKVSEDLNLGDIVKVDEKTLLDFDLMTWGFPCTSISVSGKQKGIIKGETASGLYFEGLRILAEKKPKYSIIENVKALTTKKFEKEFNMILTDLEKLGYKNYWKVINAKDFGVPQNRERVFIVSIREDLGQPFEFKSYSETSDIRIKDLIEKEVAEKYYVKKVREINIEETRVDRAIISVGQASNKGSQAGKIYSVNGIFPTFCAGTHGYAMGYIYDRGRVRRLTPLETFRMMGFEDSDYKVLKDEKVSDTQLYKMAGNSIVVNVLEELVLELFGGADKNE